MLTIQGVAAIRSPRPRSIMTGALMYCYICAALTKMGILLPPPQFWGLGG